MLSSRQRPENEWVLPDTNLLVILLRNQRWCVVVTISEHCAFLFNVTTAVVTSESYLMD